MSIAEKLTSGQTETRQFVKRKPANWRYSSAGIERRQFPNVDAELSPEAEAMGEAIDRYKMENGIRRINFEELLHVIKSLGYSQS